MLSFHNDQSVKQKYLDRVIAHGKADEIIKGTYWEDGKGCAVGCTVHSSDHSAYERELGLSRWLARLEDRIFEGLPNDEAKEFPRRFLEAIPVGVDLTMVKWKFVAFVLRGNIALVEKLKISEERREKSLGINRKVLKLYDDAIETGEMDKPADADAAAAYAAYAYAAAAKFEAKQI